MKVLCIINRCEEHTKGKSAPSFTFVIKSVALLEFGKLVTNDTTSCRAYHTSRKRPFG